MPRAEFATSAEYHADAAIRAHLLSNASMDPVSLENLTAETARTLLIGIARDAQALTGLTHEQASTVVLQAAA